MRLALALALIFAAIFYRTVPPFIHGAPNWVGNFSPLAAIVFCGALFFPRRFALWIPLAILAVSDVVLNVFIYHWPLLSWDILPRYVAFAAIGLLAFRFRSALTSRPSVTLAGSLVASLLFYTFTNTASWIAEPAYAKNLMGWTQALTTGLPGFPPSWTFFRNSIVGDLFFTGLFLVSMNLAIRSEKSPVVEGLAVAR